MSDDKEKMPGQDDVAKDFGDMLGDALAGTGRELAQGVSAVADYAAERAAHLSGAVGEEGFDLAVAAERDNVALYAGVAAVEQAARLDQRLMGLIHGGLQLGARALANLSA